MSDETLEGVVRLGPPPADADRPEVVIRNEGGEVVQAVVRIDANTVVEVTAVAFTDIDPGAFAIAGPPPRWDDFALSYHARAAFTASLVDPRSIVTGLTAS